MIDIGLLHQLEELARIGRERLDIAALALGIDGVEGERGFARARQAGDHRERVARDVDVHALEVVLARAADGDGGKCHGGGEIAWGWAIWRWPGRYFEAEHHGIWRSPEGRLHDVTPMLYGQSRILFLSDPQAVFNPACYRPNILGAEAGNKVAVDYIALADARAAILNAYGEPGVEHAITPEDQVRLDAITPRWMALYAELERG
jgi:hypothetical protein